MKIDEAQVKELLQFNNDTAQLMLGSTRMVIMPVASIGKLLEFVMTIADENMLAMFLHEMGHEAGSRDAKTMKDDFNPDTPADWLGLGPTLHSGEGVVLAKPDNVEIDLENNHFLMTGTWENSFIAEQWLERIGPASESVCTLLSGYATGYASGVFGREIEARETQCVAKGDSVCRFELRLKEEW
jgi:predicted hydrocarbon binding protein